MENTKVVSLWKEKVDPALTSKVEELKWLGYANATPEELWNCLVKKVWKGEPEKRLYEVVQDILHMRSHTYLSFITNESYDELGLTDSIEAITSYENENR
ncbi:hypothetical protein EQV77_01330 [Halobacillus fulvus]|nr:hypothetical protein EQV77_01330 [Halobacillus fulvus]